MSDAPPPTSPAGDDPADATQPVFRTPWARRWAVVVLVLMAAWTALAWQLNAWRFETQVDRAVGVATEQARVHAELVGQGLHQGLAELGGLARMLSRLAPVVRAVQSAGPGDALAGVPTPILRERLQSHAELAAMNGYLATAAEELGADRLYLLDAAGNCVAANTGALPNSVVGEHLADRAYFVQAREQGVARQFAVGRGSGIPGLFFSAGVTDAGRFVGAVVVKRDTPSIAAMSGHDGAFVTDPQGVVILAQDPRLRLHALAGARVFQRPAAERQAVYRSAQLPTVSIAAWGEGLPDSLRRVGDDPAPQVLVQRHLAAEALDVYVAQPVPGLDALRRDRILNFALLALAGVGMIAIVAAGLGGWRSRGQVLRAVGRLAGLNQQLSVQMAERRRAEGLLRESREYLVVHEARLRALLRSLPEQVWMKDRAGAYLAVNAAFERFHGQRETELLGRSDRELQDAERAARFDDEDRQTLAASEPQVFQHLEQPADGGGPRRLEISKTAVRDERGQVIGVVGVARDTTALHAADEALRRSEARFRATFETAGDAILLIRDERVADCNRRAADLLGATSPADLVGRDMALFAPALQPGGDASRALIERHVAAARRGGNLTIDWRCRRLDGSEFDAEITLSIFELGRQRLLQAVLRDVSERRRMVAALEAARDEAERANRSKSVFLANMSHEIRTPLNAVLGFTQLLRADRTLPDDAQSRLRVIHAAGNRLLGLINDVLDLAKIESGGLQVTRAPFELLQELRDLAHLFGSQARARGLALESELALAPGAVDGDRTKVGQVVANLLGNALKFTERGHIALNAWRDPADADRVWLEIADTGPGIAETDLADLFVPFRQGAAGHEKGGTGLGLALSRDLARAMGGELQVASVPGAGTQVRVWLPLPAVAGAAPGAAMAEGAQALDADTPCRVLVIEDDTHSRDVLADLLRAAGCAVVEAVDGLEGLELARSQPFDIVFSDIRMPRLNGVELIARLRADPATRALPVVAVSASSLEHERRFYVENGFQDFIGKPYPFQDVYRALVEHAGVRLHPVDAPTAGDGEHVGPGPGALAPDVRARLHELEAAAGAGRLGEVNRLMTVLGPATVGSKRWRGFEDAAQAYDFQRLEQRVRALLEAAGDVA